jgi:hypothetical protein
MHAVLFVCRKMKNKDTKIEQEWERADARYKRNELGRAREEACLKKCSGKGESRNGVKRRDFKGLLFCQFFYVLKSFF